MWGGRGEVAEFPSSKRFQGPLIPQIFKCIVQVPEMVSCKLIKVVCLESLGAGLLNFWLLLKSCVPVLKCGHCG